MITFNVVREQHGWAIRVGERKTTPFWSRDLAIREAKSLAEAISRHGERTEVIVDDDAQSDPCRRDAPTIAARRGRAWTIFGRGQPDLNASESS
jgi:hypothetical protein